MAMSPLETRFEHLQNLTELCSLVGQTEDLHLDVKEWPVRDDEAQRVLAKALSGFSNADGGILVIGLEARSPGKGEPDVIQALKPVADAVAVKSKIENLIGNLIEPPVPGIRVGEVLEVVGQPSGFVLVYIPPTDGLPVRSRKHSNFYKRVSATAPTVVYVFSPLCHYCELNEANFAAVFEGAKKTHKFLGIATVTTGLTEYLAQKRMSFQILVHVQKGDWKLSLTPQMAVVGADGRLMRNWIGMQDSKKWEVEQYFGFSLPGPSTPSEKFTLQSQ
jgi:hypothetical protein